MNINTKYILNGLFTENDISTEVDNHYYEAIIDNFFKSKSLQNYKFKIMNLKDFEKYQISKKDYPDIIFIPEKKYCFIFTNPMDQLAFCNMPRFYTFELADKLKCSLFEIGFFTEYIRLDINIGSKRGLGNIFDMILKKINNKKKNTINICLSSLSKNKNILIDEKYAIKTLNNLIKKYETYKFISGVLNEVYLDICNVDNIVDTFINVKNINIVNILCTKNDKVIYKGNPLFRLNDIGRGDLCMEFYIKTGKELKIY